MNPKPVFTGVAVALVTFFDEHGHVDTRRHREARRPPRRPRACGRSSWPGRTGEASHLSMKERLQLLDAVRAAVPATTCPSSSAPATSPPG